MARSRSSGERLEFSVTCHLIEVYGLEFYDTYSSNKYTKWKKTYEPMKLPMPYIDEFTNYNKIRLCKDTDGCTGNSSDIELHNDTELLPISLKNNNISIKHPRCGSMHKHMSERKKTAYKEEYKDINAEYLRIFNEGDITTFKEINASVKSEMYKAFRDLLIKILLESAESCRLLFQFCIGTTYSHQFIIKYEKNEIRIFKYRELDFDHVKIKKISDNTFHMTVSGITLKFRIHNASSRITSNLSLKYDVTPVDIDSLFEELNFDD